VPPYDVVVVGAGPAGSAAAISVALTLGCGPALRRAQPRRGERSSLYLFALRAYYEGVAGDPGTAGIFFGAGYFPGYAWLFLSGQGRANLGMGMVMDVSKHYGINVRERFMRWLEEDEGVRERLMGAHLKGWVVGGPLPTYRGNQGNYAERVLVVGDAGRFVEPRQRRGDPHRPGNRPTCRLGGRPGTGGRRPQCRFALQPRASVAVGLRPRPPGVRPDGRHGEEPCAAPLLAPHRQDGRRAVAGGPRVRLEVWRDPGRRGPIPPGGVPTAGREDAAPAAGVLAPGPRGSRPGPQGTADAWAHQAVSGRARARRRACETNPPALHAKEA
jgi:hypothetical protein